MSSCQRFTGHALPIRTVLFASGSRLLSCVHGDADDPLIYVWSADGSSKDPSAIFSSKAALTSVDVHRYGDEVCLFAGGNLR